jgi:nitroreductase
MNNFSLLKGNGDDVQNADFGVGTDQVAPNIQARRSCRSFLDKRIRREDVSAILKAGTLAPSGKSTQPWRFVVVQRDKELLAHIVDCTKYAGFLKAVDCLIAVYKDKQCGYDDIKDAQGMGACIENMLLQAAALGIGSCWIGEILSKEEDVYELLFPDHLFGWAALELMAVVALGYPAGASPQPNKRNVDDCLIMWK